MRLLFICYPDTDYPIGGVKQIYRQVEILSASGISAFVLHEQLDFRVSWFDSDAPVISLETFLSSSPCTTSDIFVLPETWVCNVPTFFPGFKKIIFNQNVYYTFGLEGSFDENILSLYSHPDVLGVVTVSRDNRNFLVEGCCLPDSFVHFIVNGIDSSLFYPPSIKTKRILYLERKYVTHARAVHLLALARNNLPGYTFKSVGRMSHPELASEFRSALVFLSCGHPEGFGLPLAEAIACGCITVGYHGLSGRDFCKQSLHSVDFGDTLGFVRTLESAVLGFEENPHQTASLLMSHSKEILSNYSLTNEVTTSLNVWSSFVSD